MADYQGNWDTLYWSPSEIAALATDLASWGEQVEASIKEAYNVVNNLGTTQDWTGKLFNDLAKLMNDQKGFFTHNITILAEEIPSNMNESARADANASDASFASYTPATLSQDYEVEMTSDDGTGILTFNEANVQTANEQFVNAFTTAKENLDQYQYHFNSLFNEILSNKAEAYEKYKYVVEDTVAKSTELFQTFCEAFVNNAKAAEEAIKAADAAAAAQADNISQAN